MKNPKVEISFVFTVRVNPLLPVQIISRRSSPEFLPLGIMEDLYRSMSVPSCGWVQDGNTLRSGSGICVEFGRTTLCVYDPRITGVRVEMRPVDLDSLPAGTVPLMARDAFTTALRALKEARTELLENVPVRESFAAPKENIGIA